MAKNGFVSHVHRKKPKARVMPKAVRRGNNANRKSARAFTPATTKWA
jgi:hypothetical protein